MANFRPQSKGDRGRGRQHFHYQRWLPFKLGRGDIIGRAGRQQVGIKKASAVSTCSFMSIA
jgi:hypothetical protein